MNLLQEQVLNLTLFFFFFISEAIKKIHQVTKNTAVTSPEESPAVCPQAGKKETGPPD